MSSVANTSEARLASRYEALIWLTEAVRSKQDQKDLFQCFAAELSQVVPFDAIRQFDGTTLAQWHFVAPYDTKLEALLHAGHANGELVEQWVYENQQPVIVHASDRDNRFRGLEALWSAGLHALCVLPLSTAHDRLGCLSFASHLEDAYNGDD